MQQVIHHAETDGVPVLFAYDSGPMRAGLVFRVGIADETPGRAGVTHLVEHLALHRQGLADYHFNGATKAAYTHFHVEGAPHEVVGYLNGVCASLRDLPMERLETEKEILSTEEAGRSTSLLARRRYGAHGHGLIGCPEWGTAQLRPQDVTHWAQSWFTRDNAVLWLSGDRLPAGLALILPSGTRCPMPPAVSVLPAGPAYFSEGSGGVLMDAVVTHGAAARMYGGVLEREMFRALRQEGGYSYTATTGYERRGDGYAVVTAFADALPKKQDAVLGGFVDVLAKIGVGRIEQSDFDAVRARADAALGAPDAVARRLPLAAESLLAGRVPRCTDELRGELWSVTPDDVRAAAQEAAGTALMQVPSGLTAEWAGFVPARARVPVPVDGRRFEAVGDDGSVLVVGEEGVSLTADGETVTVLFRDCAARLSWPDGGRHLVGLDGCTVPVEPAVHRVDPETMAVVDAAVHPSATVWLPPRHAPLPQEEGAGQADLVPAGREALGPARPPRTGRQRAVLTACGLLAGLCSCAALVLGVVGLVDPAAGPVPLIACGPLWGAAALLAWPAVRLSRRTRRA